MTVLPIVDRELRVAARRRGTYWMRMTVAAIAMLAFGVCFLASLIDPSVSFVKILFWGLSGLGMLFCLLAGRIMTADCLSQEKRDGTLGLLFLTDLKGYDVVLGKLAATSLGGFYGLLTVFPMLALPLVAGGLAGGEVWRMVLVLVNTFLFSAAIGLFVSAIGHNEQKVMGANFALLVFLAGIPPAIDGLLETFLPGFTLEPRFFYSCPVYSFWKSADANYKLSPRDFWWSLGATFSLTLLLLLAACLRVPQSWQDKPVRDRAAVKGQRRHHWWREGNARRAATFRRAALDRNAYFWLAARPYLKAWYVWIVLGVLACLWLELALEAPAFTPDGLILIALVANALLKLWIITEAGRQLAEDKKNGAFEGVLSTPLRDDDILRGQRLALRRQFLKPVAAAVVAELLLLLTIRHADDQIQFRWTWLAGVSMLVADTFALGWVAMLAGLTSKTYGRATIRTTLLILVLPWGLYGCAELAAHFFMFMFFRPSWNPDWPFDLSCWFIIGILVDVVLTFKAWRRLRRDFRRLALEPFTPKRRFAWLRDWWKGPPERKAELRRKFHRAALATASLAGIVAGLVYYDIYMARTNLPKPVIVSISRSNNPVRCFSHSGQEGVFFVLPDGSLWSWGQKKGIDSPQRIGTNLDWAQVSGGGVVLGLRTNGTIWTWSQSAGEDPPRQFGSDRDWVEVFAGANFSLGRKKDGTLWAWGNNGQTWDWSTNKPKPLASLGLNSGRGGRFGTDSNWMAISAYSGSEVVGLRTDGTLWVWGNVNYYTNGMSFSTNYPLPVQLCSESNWTGLRGTTGIYASNRAGESWRLLSLNGAPGESVPIAALGHLASARGRMVADGPLFTTNWTFAEYEVRANGTLWATSRSSWRPSSGTSGPPTRIGNRSDWIGIWGANQTMIGLTADGTVWTWGTDFGKQSHWTEVCVERWGFVKAIILEILGRGSQSYFYGYYSVSGEYPAQEEPRPLLRLVQSPSPGGAPVRSSLGEGGNSASPLTFSRAELEIEESQSFHPP